LGTTPRGFAERVDGVYSNSQWGVRLSPSGGIKGGWTRKKPKPTLEPLRLTTEGKKTKNGENGGRKTTGRVEGGRVRKA